MTVRRERKAQVAAHVRPVHRRARACRDGSLLRRRRGAAACGLQPRKRARRGRHVVPTHAVGRCHPHDADDLLDREQGLAWLG